MSQYFILGSEENVCLEDCIQLAKHINDLYIPLSDKGQYKAIRIHCSGRITGLQITGQEITDIDSKEVETILPLSMQHIPLHCIDTVILLPCKDVFTTTLFLQAVQQGKDKTFIIYRPREEYHTGLLQVLNDCHLFEKRNIICDTTLHQILDRIKQ